MITAIVGAIISAVVVGAVNAVYVSYKYGKLEQAVKDIPATINGTVVRSHEGRCCNYVPERFDQTNPKVKVLT